MTSANTHIAIQRLDLFSNMLLASGWASKIIDGEVCWLPPKHLRGISSGQYGAGHLHIWDALNLQARADVSIMTLPQNEAA